MKFLSKWSVEIGIILIIFAFIFIRGLIGFDQPKIVSRNEEAVRETSPQDLRFDGYKEYENDTQVFTEEEAVEAAYHLIDEKQTFLSKIISNRYIVRYDSDQKLFEVYKRGHAGVYDYYAYVYNGQRTVYYNND